MNTEKQLILVCCIILYRDLSFLKHFHTKNVIKALLHSEAFGYVPFEFA